VGVIKFSYAVPLEQTVAFEAVYHEALQLDLSTKKRFRDLTASIFVWMYVDGKLAGESYGFPLANELVKGLPELTDSEKRVGIYCYSNTILPAFQRQRFGTILKAHWLGLAAGMGFDIVYGHARTGGSQALNAKFGAVFLHTFSDWCGIGDEYRSYRLALK